MSADRNLLYGMLALHTGLVTRDQLIEAMTAWMAKKETPLGDILRERAALTDDDHRLLDGLVARQIQRHGDAAKCLASLRVDSSVRYELSRLGDAEVQATLHPQAEPGAAEVPTPTDRPAIRYRRLRPHATGGLGKVSVALDEELKREVALKEIQERFADHADSRARFVREAEITGHLEHPGVVPLYGLGAYPDGRPYYAMRFIRGESMHEAIARFHKADGGKRDPSERSLTLRELLTRFISVCDSVAYAHSRGVIHRDLKPANVMLGDYGETLVVDWGLAKVIAESVVLKTTAERPLPVGTGSGSAPTEMGQVVGTPAYMPPEQATGRLDRVGPASDVFSLGATLYCLLTGQPPYAGEDALAQAKRAEPFPARWRKETVPPALEAVCQKAMRAEPKERYATARALADEVRHWLADEPVTAHREPLAARARRWARKHREFVTAAAVGFVVLFAASVIGLAVVGGLNQQLSTSLDEAKKEREIAVAVNEFLQRDLLGQADIGNQVLGSTKEKRNPNITVAELLDRAAKKIEGKFHGQGATEATIRRTIGDTYLALSKYELALPQLERSVAIFDRTYGVKHPDTLTSKNNLAQLYLAWARYDKAEPLFLEVLRQRERKLGADHPDTLTSKNDLAELYRLQARYDKAEPLWLEALAQREKKLGADHPDTLTSKNNLALLYHSQARYEKTEPLWLEVLTQREKKLGADHPDTLTSKNNLAGLYRDQARYDKAEPLYLEVLTQSEKKLGADHPDTLLSKNNLAGLYYAQGRLDKAEPLLLEALTQREKKLGADHPDTLLSKNNLAGLYLAQGRLDKAEPLFLEVIPRLEKRLGADHPTTLASKNNLAGLYHAQMNYDKAEPLYRSMVELAREKFGPDDVHTVGAMAQLGLNLLLQKKHADAETLLRGCLRVREKAQPDDWTTFRTKSMLGEALLGQKKYAEAEPLLVQGHEGLKQRQDKIPPVVRTVRLKESLERLISVYDATGKKDEAAKYRRELDALPKADKGPAK